jgi:hypothetical protein
MLIRSSQIKQRVVPFWGVSGHFPGWFPDRDFYLVSAAGLWSRRRGKFIKRSYPSPRTRMFVDSGGFSFFSSSGDYPFGPDEYLRLIEHPYYGYRPLAWASLDYPCEPETARADGLTSNLERIEATLDYLAYFTERSTWPGLVPVVQGYTVDERLYCLEQMARRGLTRPFMAIGSLCSLTSESEIDQAIAAVGSLAADMLPFPVAWHVFGVKLSYFTLRQPMGLPYVFSFDTAAWGLGETGEAKNPKGDAEKRLRFFRYRDKVLPRLAAVAERPPISQLNLPLASSIGV